MQLDLRLERDVPHEPEVVWEAIATREGLAGWLMDNDFEPVVGRAFTFHWCTPDEPERPQTVAARLLVFDPPRQVAWSWRNEGEAEAGRVDIRLEPTASGTRVVLTHTGPVSRELGDRLTGGWPEKLDALEQLLG